MAKARKKAQAAQQQEPSPQKAKAKVKKAWAKRLYIPGFGFVDVGDEASKEALTAWTKKTNVDVDKYLIDLE